MDQKLVCSNPSCRKSYNITDIDSDENFCSFDCWEKINCKNPPQVINEDMLTLIVPNLMPN